MKKSTGLVILLLTLVLFSCRTLPDAHGTPVWESAEFVQEGSHSYVQLRMTSGSRSYLAGYAEQAENGSWIMEAETLHWFSNWPEGWSEADISVSGTLSLTEADGTWRVYAIEPVKAHYADKAAIRYRDSRFTGDQGKDSFTRRLTRITATVEHLSATMGGASFPRFTHEKKKVRKGSFEVHAGSVLFPERYGYPEGTQKSPKTRENRVRGEDILWDTLYTRNQFPEYLHEIRNSGTLYRDWEETGELFYYLYVLENLND